jgi:hypothetical protein
MRFNPPPGWPVPSNWKPSADWQPDPTWPAAPDGWHYWIAKDETAIADDGERPAQVARTLGGTPTQRRALLAAAAVAVVAVVCGATALIAYHVGKAHRADEASHRADDPTGWGRSVTPLPTTPSTFILTPDWPPYSSRDQPTGYLAAPSTTSPADGAVFSNYPRDTDLWWHPVTGAATYRIQIQYFDGIGDNEGWHDLPGQPTPITTSAATYHFEFVGAQPGRWRVNSVAADGQEGPLSPWSTFRYTR